MRIGLDASPLINQPTGIGNYIFNLLTPLCELRKEDRFFLYAHQPSVLLDRLASLPHVTVRICAYLSFSEALWSQTTLAYLIYKDKLDLFWGTTQSIPVFTKKGQHNVMSVHDFTYLLYPQTVSTVRRIYLQLFSRWMMKKADLLLSISYGTQKKLHTFYQYPSQVLQPPLKPTLRFYSQKEVMPYLQTHGLLYKKYVVMLGTIEPRKHIFPTLQAYANIESPLLPIVLIGKRGWYPQEAWKQLKKNKVMELGYLPDEEISYLLSGARFLLMPSLYEGYGMGIKEARSLHCPVICSNVEEMLEAAEGDALILRQGYLQEDLRTYLSCEDEGPKEILTRYPSNQHLAIFLSSQFSNLIV